MSESKDIVPLKYHQGIDETNSTPVKPGPNRFGLPFLRSVFGATEVNDEVLLSTHPLILLYVIG